MNKSEVIAVIAVIEEEVSERGHDPDYAEFEKLKAAGFDIKVAEQEGGEGEGSHYHIVLKLTKDNENTFVKCDGYYASHEGTSWESADIYEVKPVKVEINSWAKV